MCSIPSFSKCLAPTPNTPTFSAIQFCDKIQEDKEGKNILSPIRIDDYVNNKWQHERKADVLRKVVGDFSGRDKDAAKYEKAFDKLLKGAQAETAGVG